MDPSLPPPHVEIEALRSKIVVFEQAQQVLVYSLPLLRSDVNKPTNKFSNQAKQTDVMLKLARQKPLPRRGGSPLSTANTDIRLGRIEQKPQTKVNPGIDIEYFPLPEAPP